MNKTSSLHKEISVLEKSINSTLEHCFNEMYHCTAENFIEIARKHDCSKQIFEYMSKCQLTSEGYNYIPYISQKLVNFEITNNTNRDITLKCFSYILFGTKCTDNAIESEKMIQREAI
jgi:hypothetical protein